MTEETIKKTISILQQHICNDIQRCDSETVRLSGKMNAAYFKRNEIKDENSIEYEAYAALYDKYYERILALKEHRNECIDQRCIDAINKFMELKDKE